MAKNDPEEGEIEEDLPPPQGEDLERETTGEHFDLLSPADQRKQYQDQIDYRDRGKKPRAPMTFSEYASRLHRRRWWKLTPDLKKRWHHTREALGPNPLPPVASSVYADLKAWNAWMKSAAGKKWLKTSRRWYDDHSQARKALIQTMIARHRGEGEAAPSRQPPVPRARSASAGDVLLASIREAMRLSRGRERGRGR